MSEQYTYGGWRLPTTGGLAGFNTSGTVVLFVAIVVPIIALSIDLLLGLIAIGVMALLLAPLLISVGGRTGAQAIATRLAWWRGRWAKQDSYWSGSVSPVPAGQTRLPGLLAPSQLLAARDAYGRPVGIIRVPHGQHYTVVLRGSADGADLVDQDQIDRWVAGWGQWLAGLGDEPGLLAVQVTIETSPDSGQRLADEVDQLVTEQAPAAARQVLAETAVDYPATSPRVTTRVAITWGPHAISGKLTDTDMAIEIGNRLPDLCDGLARSGAGAAAPLGPDAVAEMVRVAYDPAAEPDLDADRGQAQSRCVEWHEAGPMAQQEYWSWLRHDSGASATWAMEEATRGAVRSRTLTRLLSPHPRLPRKRVTLTYRPYDPGAAASIVDADVRHALFNATNGGRRNQARLSADLDKAQKSAAAEAAGAGLVLFSALVTVTVPEPEQLGPAASVVRNLGQTARLRLRRCYGHQSSAFAGALGAGVILPTHASTGSRLTG